MMRSTGLTGLWAGALFALAGCSSEPTPREAMEDALGVTCDLAFECRSSFPQGDLVFAQFYGSSPSECRTRFAGLIDIAAIEASIEAGRIEYDGGDAAECIDLAAERTCTELWSGEDEEEPAACETAFRGTVTTGGLCTHDMDCAGADDCSDGVCTPDT